MGAVIKGVAICDKHPDSAIDNAVGAGLNCLTESGCEPEQIDLLINVGIYREDNIMEPSIASLIQQKMKVNLDPARQGIQRRTFSFDLANGACGFLNAVGVAAAALARGQVRNALILSADLHPSRITTSAFPFTNVGGAVLLQHDADPLRGFGAVDVNSSNNGDYQGYLTHGEMEEFGNRGRAFALFSGQADYPARFCEYIVESAIRCLNREKIRPGELDALITTQVATGFPSLVAEGVGVQADCCVPDLHAGWGDPHTSVPAICLHQLCWDQQFVPGKKILFASVSAGISSACAVYRV